MCGCLCVCDLLEFLGVSCDKCNGPSGRHTIRSVRCAFVGARVRVCVHVCVRVCVSYKNMYACACMFSCKYMHARTHARTHARNNARIDARTHKHTHLSFFGADSAVLINGRVLKPSTCTHAHIRAYIHICMQHACKHTHSHPHSSSLTHAQNTHGPCTCTDA